MAEDKTIPSLEVNDTPSEEDLVITSVDGAAKKTEINQLRYGIQVANPSEKGLMAAGDKAALDELILAVAALGIPQVLNVLTDTILALPEVSGTYTTINLSGTTEVTSVTGLSAGRLYIVKYATGAGVTFMGTPLIAGDSFLYLNI